MGACLAANIVTHVLFCVCHQCLCCCELCLGDLIPSEWCPFAYEKHQFQTAFWIIFIDAVWPDVIFVLPLWCLSNHCRNRFSNKLHEQLVDFTIGIPAPLTWTEIERSLHWEVGLGLGHLPPQGLKYPEAADQNDLRLSAQHDFVWQFRPPLIISFGVCLLSALNVAPCFGTREQEFSEMYIFQGYADW